jgi:hypothetical protein
MTDVNYEGGWDTYPSWAHGREGSTAGVYSIAVVCIPILGSQHVTNRLAANGYHDKVNDFGY